MHCRSVLQLWLVRRQLRLSHVVSITVFSVPCNMVSNYIETKLKGGITSLQSQTGFAYMLLAAAWYQSTLQNA